MQQTGTVSRLWLCGRSWRFEIHFWRNIVRFWKSYFCSNKLDVQETNFCFSQFNRIWNHLVGHWTEIGRFACSGTMGSNCVCSWKCFLAFQIDRGNLIVMFTNVMSLTRKSMWWKTLILFLQMFNPRVKKLYCMCLRTMKLWSRWSLKGEVLQWDMFPQLTELLLIGCSIWINLDSKIQIKYIDTKNQLADSLTKGSFHTWWVESFVEFVETLAISVLQLALLQWQNELNKNQEKNESQQNQDLWWIYQRGCLRTCRLQLH